MLNNIIDVLRGMYMRVPVPVRKSIAPVLSLLPAGTKYGATYKNLRVAIKKSEADAEYVRRYQKDRLETLMNVGLKKTAYYKSCLGEKLDIPGYQEIEPSQFVMNLPILKKDIIRDRVEDLLAIPKENLDEISTSGSSGRPLRFYLDRNRSVKEWAFIHHIWSKAGYQTGDKRAVLRGVNIESVDKRPWEYDSALNELRLSPFHLTKEHIERFLIEIARRGIIYFHGYPSALSLVAKHVLRIKWTHSDKVRAIFPISETLMKHQREELRDAFPNAKLLPFYGLSEKVAIAGEVDGEFDTYEFEPLYGITELVDESGLPVTTQGGKGRIVSTGLLNLGMPLLRYDTEDDAILVAAPCESNAYRLRVRNLRSRWSQEYVVGRNGELVSIAAINIHSSAYSWIREFQFRQITKGIVQVCVVPQHDAKNDKLVEFVNEIQNKVGSSIRFDLQVVDKIKRNPRGKSKFIVQGVDLGDDI